ncbi:MAG: type II secretion system protein, partial [Planctomycetota bacterium]
MVCVQRSDRDGGFTLIELLVVMGIIAVLAAMLMPALQKAREAAHRTSCLNNMNQFGDALAMYQKDHGSIPAYHNLSWAERNPFEVNDWSLLYPNYISSAETYFCPSEESAVTASATADIVPSSRQSLGGYVAKNGDVYMYPMNGDPQKVRFGLNVWGWCCQRQIPGFLLGKLNMGADEALQTVCGRKLQQDRANLCKKAGIINADDVSYVAMGNSSLSATEKRESAKLRVVADNEHEGDEMCTDGFGAAGSKVDIRTQLPNHVCGLIPDNFNGDHRAIPHMTGPMQYHYVGGLETADNHGRD